MHRTTIFFMLLMSFWLGSSAHYFVPSCGSIINTRSCCALPDSNSSKGSSALILFSTSKIADQNLVNNFDYTFNADKELTSRFNLATSKLPIMARIFHKPNFLLLLSKSTASLKPARIKKWAFSGVMRAVCNYINKGIKVKYYTPALLIAQSR